ncbi:MULTISPECIES: EpsG family protein [Aeromonas]|uniref:EpsG family protein n=1 Tax=Aeromonas TaxID=642 RepID=UPI001118B9F1|nr:EpsG family protein [Aeromonas veronii]TNI83882.1 hypothetical protein CF119_14745 [Aeromonas sobria]
MKLDKLIAYTIGFIYSIFLSYFVTTSNYHNRDGSDLIAYEHFYNCLSSDSIDVCRIIISSNYEVFFYYLLKFFSLASFDFFWFIFFFSFFIYFSLVTFVVKYSREDNLLYLFAFVFLLTDFRYYDYGFNIIRHGSASTMMLIVIGCFLVLKSNVKYILLIFPVLFHLSAIAQLSLLIRARVFYSRIFWFFLFLFFFALVFSPFFSWMIESFFNIGYLGDKLSHYLAGDRHPDWIPLQYFLILVLSLLLNINMRPYLLIRQVFFSLISLSIIVFPIGMSYRFVAYAMPFSAVLLTYQIGYICSSFERRTRVYLYMGSFIAMILFGSLNIYKYYEFILGGLK